MNVPPGPFLPIPPAPVAEAELARLRPRRWLYPVGGPCMCVFGGGCTSEHGGPLDPEAALQARVEWHRYAEAAMLGAIRAVADEQRGTAEDLRDMVTRASQSGITWQALGDAVGIPGATLWRQVHAGSPVVVARAYHTRREAADG